MCRSLEPPPWCRSPRQRQAFLRSPRTRCSPHKMTVKACTVAAPRARRARVYQQSRRSSAQVPRPNHLWRRVGGKDLRRCHNLCTMGIAVVCSVCTRSSVESASGQASTHRCCPPHGPPFFRRGAGSLCAGRLSRLHGVDHPVNAKHYFVPFGRVARRTK